MREVVARCLNFYLHFVDYQMLAQQARMAYAYRGERDVRGVFGEFCATAYFDC